jgi:hypothetical protein
MDFFCIAQGFLFDNPSIVTLEGPMEHSVHCLLDVPECINTPFEILLPPSAGGGGLYSRGYRLDDDTKAEVVALGKQEGVCGDCDSTGTIEKGFTVVVQGQVVQEAVSDVPPTITGTVTLSNPNSPVCALQAATPSMTPGTAPPTSAAPIAATLTPSGPPASVSPTVRPTATRAYPSLTPLAATTTPTSNINVPSSTPVAAIAPSSLPTSPATPASPGGAAPSGSPVQGGGGGSSNGPSNAATSAGACSSQLWIVAVFMAWIVAIPIK